VPQLAGHHRNDRKASVAGQFTTVGGLARKNAAAINVTDASVNPSFHPSAQSAKSVLATGAAVYVGGSKLAAYNPVGSSNPGSTLADYTAPVATTVSSLRAHTTNPAFRDIVDSGFTTYGGDPILVVACQCDALNGVFAKSVAQIDALTGAVLPWNPFGLGTANSSFGIQLIVRSDPSVNGGAMIYLAAGGSDFTAAYAFSATVTTNSSSCPSAPAAPCGQQLWKTDTSGSSQAVIWYQGPSDPDPDLIVGGHFDWTANPAVGATACGDNSGPNTSCYHTPKLVAMSPATGAVALVNGAAWNPGICCLYNGVWSLLAVPQLTGGLMLNVGGEFTRAGGTWSGSGTSWTLKGAASHTYYARFPDLPTT